MTDISLKLKDHFPLRGKFAIADINKISPEALDQLNKAEMRELEAFTNLKRQQEYLTSRLVIKEIARQWQIDPQEFKVLKDELGRPYGADEADQYFVSIAHTRQKVFCGITSDSAIGVDLEPVDRNVSERLRKRILHPDEVRTFSGMAVIRLWTIKEALIKLEGQGLRLSMNGVHVQKSGEEDFFAELNNDKTAKICSFQAENNWLAIAYYQ